MSAPLTGLRVVDLTQVLSGPYCTMLLADLGADVVKVEPPGGDVARRWGPHPAGAAAYGGYFASVNRNKRGACLDLGTAGGRETLLRLVDRADVLVENFRPGVPERLGLAYEDLRARRPRLVYAALRGFGDPRTGASPYADRPAYDVIAQAMGGLLGITGPGPERPVKAGPGVGDIVPAMLAAVGILAAVRHADRTGEGDFVDVALYDGVLALTERIVYQHSITGASPVPQGNTHPLLCPYGVFATGDGWVAVAAPSDRHWARLAALIGCDRPEWTTNAARVSSAGGVDRAVAAWTGRRPTAEVLAALAGTVPCGPVNTAADIAADPHVAAREMIVQVPHPDTGESFGIAGTPIKLLSAAPGPVRRAPLLGEHGVEVLAEWERTD